jgi:predicted Zn-dependent protease
MGQQGAKEVAQSIGIYNDAAVNAYVEQIGKRMAAQSERPNLPWEFHVVDDASVNAFAIPGGFIYVTRGLMGSINTEAELATVIGHEIAHVTNRHSVQQIGHREVRAARKRRSQHVVPQVRPGRRESGRSRRVSLCSRAEL